MRTNIQPEAISLQQLKVARLNATIGCMETDQQKAAFAARLNAICDDNNIPPKGKGRQTSLSKMFKLSQNAVLKWLEGEGYPSLDMAQQIATWSGVHLEWLLTGRGPKDITTLHTAEPSPKPYHRPDPADTAAAVITGLHTLLYLAGLPKNALGQPADITTALIGGHPPTTYSLESIHAATVEVVTECADNISDLTPNQVAQLIAEKLIGWIDAPADTTSGSPTPKPHN